VTRRVLSEPRLTVEQARGNHGEHLYDGKCFVGAARQGGGWEGVFGAAGK